MRNAYFPVLALLLSGCALQTPLVASATADGKYWVLTEPLKYEQPRTHQQFIVPVGFVTDFASVPRIFWTAFPPCGRYTPAAVVHDYLYWEQSEQCNRECADTLLLVAMEESGVKPVSRRAIYAGVRFRGQSAWDSNAVAKGEGHIRVVPDRFLPLNPNETWDQLETRIRSGARSSNK